MTTFVSIATAGSPVVIDETLGEDTKFFLDTEGLGDPAMVWRFGQMPDSQDVHGREITSAVLEVSALPLVVWVVGDTAAEVETNRSTLWAALSQFIYETTVVIDDSGLVWTCDPGDLAVRGGLVKRGYRYLRPYAITIPVHPIPAPYDEES